MLTPDRPVEYERHALAEDIAYLATFPQAATARGLGLSERGWRKIVKGDVTPLTDTAERITEIAETYHSARLDGPGTRMRALGRPWNMRAASTAANYTATRGRRSAP